MAIVASGHRFGGIRAGGLVASAAVWCDLVTVRAVSNLVQRPYDPAVGPTQGRYFWSANRFYLASSFMRRDPERRAAGALHRLVGCLGRSFFWPGPRPDPGHPRSQYANLMLDFTARRGLLSVMRGGGIFERWLRPMDRGITRHANVGGVGADSGLTRLDAADAHQPGQWLPGPEIKH
ncbi:MAG: hypothetical protein H0T59_03665 [Chloroflexi bacterium]|nr:hypothetical protein [Chloroflexota bacterium]